MDRQDPLAPLRSAFHCPDGLIYLDGNSLGALPIAVAPRLAEVVREEWGTGLIRSWNEARWMDAPRRIGEKIGRLLGAQPGELIVTDSTSINLFKLLAGALKARPGRPVILTEAQNFPTDLYMAEGLVALLGGAYQVRRVDGADIETAIDERVAVLMLTHVDYTTGLMHDLPRLTAAAHRRGALSLWDLSHSAGAVPVELDASEVDLAVGCGYKYLNGGPGAPAYLFVARRLQEAVRSPLTGWMGHADPFAFEGRYRPASGIASQLCGTPSILAMAALEVAIDLWLGVEQAEVGRKCRALGDLFIGLVDETSARSAVSVASPRDAMARGSHVALRHPEGYRIMRALIDRGVIGDFRPPDLMRFGFAPLYIRYVDVWDAVHRLRDVLESRAWEQPQYATRLPVT